MKTNNNDQRGITHHLMLIGLAVIVAGAIGFAGFRIYKSKNDISAKAAYWTPLGSTAGGSKAYACRPSASSVKVQFQRSAADRYKFVGAAASSIKARSSDNYSSRTSYTWTTNAYGSYMYITVPILAGNNYVSGFFRTDTAGNGEYVAGIDLYRVTTVC